MCPFRACFAFIICQLKFGGVGSHLTEVNSFTFLVRYLNEKLSHGLLLVLLTAWEYTSDLKLSKSFLLGSAGARQNRIPELVGGGERSLSLVVGFFFLM